MTPQRLCDIDPRASVLERRLGRVRKIVAIGGGKGGIGKSSVASTLALSLADRGRRVGLLDLDFTGPSCHVVLGAQTHFPSEPFGIAPTPHAGIKFLSIVHFLGMSPAPMRGDDSTQTFLELFSITQWQELDVLIVDMPPGLGDAVLDLMRFLKRAVFLVVATASPVVLETVRRSVSFLEGQNVPILGLIENMAQRPSAAVRDFATQSDLNWFGSIPFDDAWEAAVGDVARVRQTSLYRGLQPLEEALFEDALST